MSEIIKRGDIHYANLGSNIGSEQGGRRPVLIIQNNIGNKFSPTVIIASITSRTGKAKIPTHVGIDAYRYGLPANSVVLLEQIRTIDKSRLENKIGQLDTETMNYIDKSLKISLGVEDIRFDERYIHEQIGEIKRLNCLILKYKYKPNVDLTMEELEKISIMGDIINYCKNFGVDCRIYLEEFNFLDKIAI